MLSTRKINSPTTPPTMGVDKVDWMYYNWNHHYRSREMIENKYKNAIQQIWGSESHNVSLLLSQTGTLYAECESTMDRRVLTDNNYREQLNDMFYNYCMEKAAWMGVS